MNDDQKENAWQVAVTEESHFKKQLTTVTSFSKYLAFALFIILPVVGFYLGVEYSKSLSVPGYLMDGASVDVQEEVKNNQEQITANVKDVVELRDVVMNVTLSSLSAPKAKIDLFWNYSVTGQEAKIIDSRGSDSPFIGIAEPLHLIESFELINNSSTSVYLQGISNEQVDYIDILIGESIEKATPIMLLSDTFVDDAGTEYSCQNRDLLKIMKERYFPYASIRVFDIDNKCYFDKPLVIEKGEKLSLTPVPYIVSYGKTGEVIHDPFRSTEESPSVFKATLPAIGGEYWLMPRSFEKYDDVLEANTFNVGGYLVANLEDSTLMNQIFDLSTAEGESVEFMLGETETSLPLISYKIPYKVFSATSTTEFNDNVLGLQVFLYFNDFLEKSEITGIFDANTVTSLQDFQRKVNVYPSGVFDQGTARSVLGSEFKNLVRYWENYADEVKTFGLSGDGKYFRYWGEGRSDVSINDTYDDSASEVYSHIYYTDSSDSGLNYHAEITYTDARTEESLFRWFMILNNTDNVSACTVIDGNGVTIESFSLDVNEIHGFSDSRATVPERGIYDLRCGDKILRVELTTLSEGRG